MDNLIKSLPTILRAAGEATEVKEAAAIAAWKHAAGEGLRDHAMPVRLQGRTLIVAVADAVWQKQLGSMLGQMLFRVNHILGQPLVSYIELQIDPRVLAQQARKAEERQHIAGEVPPEILEAANSIADKQLRQTFLRAALMQTHRLENR